MIKPVVPEKYLDEQTIFHLNPSGGSLDGELDSGRGARAWRVMQCVPAIGGGGGGGGDPQAVNVQDVKLIAQPRSHVCSRCVARPLPPQAIRWVDRVLVHTVWRAGVCWVGLLANCGLCHVCWLLYNRQRVGQLVNDTTLECHLPHRWILCHRLSRQMPFKLCFEPSLPAVCCVMLCYPLPHRSLRDRWSPRSCRSDWSQDHHRPHPAVLCRAVLCCPLYDRSLCDRWPPR